MHDKIILVILSQDQIEFWFRVMNGWKFLFSRTTYSEKYKYDLFQADTYHIKLAKNEHAV